MQPTELTTEQLAAIRARNRVNKELEIPHVEYPHCPYCNHIPALLSHADALAAKVAQLEEWFDCDDEMPDEGEYVLGLSEECYEIVRLNTADNCWEIPGAGFVTIEFITHWKHLSERPRKGATHVAHD